MIKLILAALLPGVQIDGAWLDADAARGKGIVISESVEDGRRVRTVTNDSKSTVTVECFDISAKSTRRLGAKGYWREEAGIRKYNVGRDTATSEAEAKAAYARPVGGKTWKITPSMTLDEVNELEVMPGDKVLFQRGGVWRGQLQPRSGKPGHPITYGAFGEGAKPVIQPSYARSSAGDWREVRAVREGADSTGLWKTESGAAADIGNVILVGAGSRPPQCAFKKGRLEDVKDDLDYWCDPKTFAMYMRSARRTDPTSAWVPVNPAERFASIELCEKVHCIEEAKMHDVVYEGLALRYTAAHGIGGDGVKRITVRDCDIGWIGGGYLYYDKKGNGVRYGNGIEFWANCEDVLVESNRVYECWDAALTNQSNEDGALQKNIVWRGNEVWNCEYSYEYWQQGDNAKTENVVVKGNRFRDAGKGWGHRQRWNPNAAHLMFYDTTAETRGFVVADNIFSRSEDTLFRFFNDWRARVIIVSNRWEADGKLLCRFHGRPTANLVYKYPDRLDQMHEDNLAEIESQTASKPRVFRSNELEDFLRFLRPEVTPPPAPPRNATLRTASGPLVQAHRGGRAEYDDNAAGGFAWCVNQGVRGFETDVRFTKDKRLVVMHDKDVSRTTDGKGVVSEMTFDELRKLRLKKSGELVPTAEEVFQTLKRREDVFIEIEMKAKPDEFYTPEILEDYCRKLTEVAESCLAAGTYAYTCFNTGTLEAMHRVAPNAPIGLIVEETLTDEHLELARRLRCCSVAPVLATTKEMVDKAHAAGLTVCLWMVQDEDCYVEAREKGADRITTDYPLRIEAAVRR